MTVPSQEAEAKEIFEKYGDRPRQYRNGLGLAVPAADQIEVLRRSVRYLLAAGATVFAVSEVNLGRRTSVREAYRFVRGKLLRILGVELVYGLGVAMRFALLIIPGIFALLRYAVALPSALKENLRVFAAMERSWKLTKGSSGRIFLVYLLSWVLYVVAAFVFEYPFLIALAIFQMPWLETLAAFGSFISGVLVGPLFTIAITLVYFDQRVRKEGFDLDAMMGAIDRTTPGRPASSSNPASLS